MEDYQGYTVRSCLYVKVTTRICLIDGILHPMICSKSLIGENCEMEHVWARPDSICRLNADSMRTQCGFKAWIVMYNMIYFEFIECNTK